MYDDTFVEPDIPQHPLAASVMDEAPVDAPTHVE